MSFDTQSPGKSGRKMKLSHRSGHTRLSLASQMVARDRNRKMNITLERGEKKTNEDIKKNKKTQFRKIASITKATSSFNGPFTKEEKLLNKGQRQEKKM